MSPCHGRVPRKHLNPKNRPKPHNAYVLLDLKPSAIVPGQSVEAEWSIFFPKLPDFDIGHTVIADLTLQPEDICVYRGSEIPYEVGEKLKDTVTLAIPESIFKFPGKILVPSRHILLEITGDGVDPGPFEADAELIIEKEIVQPDWWQWNAKSGSMNYADWKSNLDVNGSLINRSKWMHIQKSEIKLYEVNRTESPYIESDIRNSTTGAIDPLAKKSVTFDAVNQTWDWIEDLTWRPKEDLSIIFDYRVEFTVTDFYGNVYPSESVYLAYTVSVPSAKISWQVAAAASRASALVLYGLALACWYVPPAAAALGAEATLVMAAATESHERAMDPPEPDPRYLEVVVRRPSRIANVPSEGSRMGSLAKIIDRILANAEAISQIHGRLIGARLARDNNGMRIQKNSYIAMLNDWTYCVKLLRKTFSVRKMKESYELSPEIQSTFMDGIRNNYQLSKLLEPKMGSDNICAQDHGLYNEKRSDVPMTPGDIISLLMESIVSSMEHIIKDTQKESFTILDPQ
jgi:hypothetical protein